MLGGETDRQIAIKQNPKNMCDSSTWTIWFWWNLDDVSWLIKKIRDTLEWNWYEVAECEPIPLRGKRAVCAFLAANEKLFWRQANGDAENQGLGLMAADLIKMKLQIQWDFTARINYLDKQGNERLCSYQTAF